MNQPSVGYAPAPSKSAGPELLPRPPSGSCRCLRQCACREPFCHRTSAQQTPRITTALRQERGTPSNLEKQAQAGPRSKTRTGNAGLLTHHPHCFPTGLAAWEYCYGGAEGVWLPYLGADPAGALRPLAPALARQRWQPWAACPLAFLQERLRALRRVLPLARRMP